MPFSQTRRSGSISTQLMMFLIFVVFPASWTAFAPVSRIRLERDNQAVTATVKQYMYFVVPFYTQQLTDVSKVRVETFQGQKQGYNAHLSETENRPNRRGDSEDNSQLILSNSNGDEARVPVDLSLSETIQRSIETFIASEEMGFYSVSVPAHRIFYLLSFPIVFLTALYLLIQALTITRLVFGNPYWPFSVEFANQMTEIARARRDRSNMSSD